MPLRGYASHIFVEFDDGRKCPVYFIDLTRLSQELDDGIRSGTPYFSEPGLVVLPEVTTLTIHSSVEKLILEGYFDKMFDISKNCIS